MTKPLKQSNSSYNAQRFAKHANSLLYGVVNAIRAIPTMYGYAVIIFSHHAFADFMPALSKLVIFSSAVHQVMFTLMSTMPFAIGQVQDAGLIFLSAMATSICNSLGDDVSPEAKVATTIVTIGIATASLGVCLVVMGRFKLAALTSYLPMPVIGGYLAFIGVFCLYAGLALSTGLVINDFSSMIDMFHDTHNILLCVPGFLGGAILLVVSQNFKNRSHSQPPSWSCQCSSSWCWQSAVSHSMKHVKTDGLTPWRKLPPSQNSSTSSTSTWCTGIRSQPDRHARQAVEGATLKLEQFQRQVLAIKRASTASGSVDEDLHDRIRFACLLQEEIAKALARVPVDAANSLIKRKLCKDFETREQEQQQALKDQQQDGRIVAEHQGQVFEFAELENEIAHNEALIEEREQDINKIHQSVAQVNEIFRDLAAIVQDQQGAIDDIETHVHESMQQTQQGLDEVKKASDAQGYCTIQ
ncbi:Guanylyl cyclase inhibitory protein [Phytophthora nicotianae]|uniref:Guanylyl cyclase inhibitory protein n=1 Tax=Phytophthora nicotianae TaxID=4792 RepID=A0A0W8DA49_PHYNI|nr:Guanylyl cyclase inhibitory protein [Phytophthora nicotianae]